MTLDLLDAALDRLDDHLERARRDESIQEEAARLSTNLRGYLEAAWPVLEPPRWRDGQRRSTFRSNWHIDAICEHLEAARAGEIRRLLINIPPRCMKSLTVSVIWPTWRWTFDPEHRFLTFSYADDLAQRDAVKSRDILRSRWFRERWPTVELKRDVNRLDRYENTAGGHRIAEHVKGGTGEGGDTLIIDDPHNAEDVHSDAKRGGVLRWHSNTVATRFNDPSTGVQVLVMQRLHEKDLSGHVLEQEGWTHLPLPMVYDPKLPFLWPDDARDPGDLLWPSHVPVDELASLQSGMTQLDIAGQFQQAPSPPEGAILKRKDWRYYDREFSFYARHREFTQEVAVELASAVGEFRFIVHSWDTSLKDQASNDPVAGSVWGACRDTIDRFLLRRHNERMSLNATIETMSSIGMWAMEIWPDVPHYFVIEDTANGPDVIRAMRKKLTGVTPWAAKGDKEFRARAASPALEGHNCFVPGEMLPDGTGPGPNTPAAIQEFIELCAKFGSGSPDDDIDAWSQAQNYILSRGSSSGTAHVVQGRTDLPRR